MALDLHEMERLAKERAPGPWPEYALQLINELRLAQVRCEITRETAQCQNTRVAELAQETGRLQYLLERMQGQHAGFVTLQVSAENAEQLAREFGRLEPNIAPLMLASKDAVTIDRCIDVCRKVERDNQSAANDNPAATAYLERAYGADECAVELKKLFQLPAAPKGK